MVVIMVGRFREQWSVCDFFKESHESNDCSNQSIPCAVAVRETSGEIL
jgi:hypothetical protein